MFKADLHIHSEYSMDCKTTLAQVVQACQKKNINCIALADHGAIEGAIKLKQIAPFYVIVAEEILTTSGEIMGLFLNELVPSGLSLRESIQRIKAQGGLFCAQHPFDKFRPDALKSEVMDEIVKSIDLVEIFNARTPLLRTSDQAKKFALKHRLPASAGSDAHTFQEIGNAYVEMPEFKGKEDFLTALSQGKVNGHRTSLISRMGGVWAKINK